MVADQFHFYSGSKDAAPGEGARERVTPQGAGASKYAYLAGRPGWRRVLSNFHECPFAYEGKRYKTIEHAFHATKVGMFAPRKADADVFSMDSGSAVGLGDGAAAKRAGGKRGVLRLSPAQAAEWGRASGRAMLRIASHKFAQCPEAAKVLLATMDAQLWHVEPRKKDSVRFRHLEAVRDAMADHFRAELKKRA